VRAEVIDDLKRIDQASGQMGAMISELSDIGRMHTGRDLVLQRHPFDLVAMVKEQAATAQKQSRKHRIQVQAGVDELTGTWDQARLTRVVSNLLTNAVKFSPKGGQVTLRLQREGDEAVLEVSDTGVGIPKAEQAHVFDPYFRASNVAEHIEGTGVGLASVKKIVEQHGGSVEIRSEEGQGTTVTIRLPLS
jgi:signal transduction histidine kinase